MFILDTNVVAELMKVAPDEAVTSWMNGQAAADLFLTTITVGEIFYGTRLLPPGKRRLRLEQGFESILSGAFEGRVLAFDEAAARHYGDIMGRRREIGRPQSVQDGEIASIARVKGYSVVTRNVKDFTDCGVAIVDPFAAR